MTDDLSSSRDLHPDTGGRFTFEREPGVEPPRYRVHVYLPAKREWVGELEWIADEAKIVGPEPTGSDGEWVRGEVIKLARVLRRDPKQRLVRWRG